MESRSQRWRRHDRIWFAVSCGLHVVALAALVWLTPVRDIVREVVRQTRPQATMSGAELQKLAESIEWQAADQIRANAEELERVLGEMAEIYDSMAVEFEQFAQRQRQQAARDAMQEMQTAINRMDEATQAIESGMPVETVDRLQALAEQAQQRAGRKLEMVEYDVSAAAQSHAAAEKQHQQAKALHDEHRRQLAQVADTELQVEDRDRRLEEEKEKLQRMQENAEQGGRLKRQQETVQRLQQQAGELSTALIEHRQRAEQLQQQAAEAQAAAAGRQREAAESLREAIESQSALPARGAAEAGPDGAREAMATLQPPFEVPEARNDAKEDIALGQLYNMARSFEDEIAEGLKEVRAMDLAIVRDILLDDARRDIDVVKPVRPGLDESLLQEAVRTDERFEAHKAEVEKALRETTSMVNLAHQMLEMANQSAEKLRFGTQAPAAATAPLERPEFELIIRELAMEDVSGRFSDMSAMMQAMAQQEAGAVEEDAAGEGMAAAGAPPQDIRDLTEEQPEGAQEFRLGQQGDEAGGFAELTPDVPAVGARKLSGNGWPGRWMYIDSWYTIGPFPNPNRINIDREFPPDSVVDLDATYIGKGGRTIRWEFVQSESPRITPAHAEEYGIWYAYTDFYCDEPRDVWIAAGTDDRGTLKINGVPVWISSKQLKGWDIDEVWRKVHFRKGVNRILFRVENGWLHIGFSLTLRLIDQEQ